MTEPSYFRASVCITLSFEDTNHHPFSSPPLLQTHINKYSLIPNSSFPNLLLLPRSFCFQLLFCFTLGLSFKSFYCSCGPYTKLLIHSGVSFNQSAVECIMECLEMRYTSREQSLETKECAGEDCHFLGSTLLQILLHKHKTNHSDVVNI